MKYIILDTNCFLEAIRDSKSMHFDYDGIKYYARNQGVYIVITAYTLYEIIKGLRKLPDIEEFRRQLIKFGDFYVLQNKILDHDFLEYGIDFLFLLKLHSNETMLEFADKQEELRKRVYK